MGDLGDLMRSATQDVPERDTAAQVWTEGRRRRTRARAVTGVAAAAVMVTAAMGGWAIGRGGGEQTTDAAGTTTLSADASATVSTGAAPRTRPAAPSAPTSRALAPSRTGGTVTREQDPAVWHDQRLITPARPAPPRSTWVILVLERTVGGAPRDVAHLDGTTWQQVPGGTYPWIGEYRQVEFSAGGVSATGGCNAGGGAYTVSGDRFRVPSYALTAMGCGDTRLMTMDETFADLAEDAVVVLGDDGRLYLAGYVSVDHVPSGWTGDNRLAPYRGPGPTTTPPWATHGDKPHTYPGPRQN